MRIKPGRPVLAAAAVALIATTGVAPAASPIKGATYSGTLKLPHATSVVYGISFKVSPNGKNVSGFALPNGYPVYCEGGGFGQVQSGSGKVTRKGTFSVKLPIYFAPVHQHQGFVIVTGSFGKHGKASGKVKTDFTKAKACNGTSSYTATG
ncbi:MAG TPA: hypothetical protein VGY30_06275 [Solirubrobacteraceae bacterium]|jgi:hypothetical protein|nr:hypothetical protein [Solirubrobacteraceae bacterium]